MDEVLALDISHEKRVQKKVKKTKDKVTSGEIVLKDAVPFKVTKPKNVEADRGLVYVGHIPHGFYETEMREYFKQFGKVTNVRVNRSKKTGASKGFGFVEFLEPKVAEIAAETMNNYLMFKRRLIAKYIPPDQQKKNVFKSVNWSKRNFPMKTSREESSRVHNNNFYLNYEDECKGMLKGITDKVQKLKELGISYDFKPSDVPLITNKEETTNYGEGELEISQKSDSAIKIKPENPKLVASKLFDSETDLNTTYVADQSDPDINYKVPRNYVSVLKTKSMKKKDITARKSTINNKSMLAGVLDFLDDGSNKKKSNIGQTLKRKSMKK